MSYRDSIHTIQDLLKMAYGGKVNELIGEVKKDAPILTNTTGAANTIFGPIAFSQLNQEANAFAALPKLPWLRSGMRAMTTRSASSGGGVAENAALPATVKPTIATFELSLKEYAHNFNISMRQQLLAKVDDNFGDLEFLRKSEAVTFAELHNIALLTDFDTLAGNNFESLDRISGSDNEETSLGYTAGDADIYGLDRTSTSWADGSVSHNSGTDRSFTDKLLRDLMSTQRTAGGEASFVLTGHDTYSAIQDEYSNAVRYNPLGMSKVQFGVNGVQTASGTEVGVDISTVYGKPVILSKNTPQDTISRVYLFDTHANEEGDPRLYFKMMMPPTYFETGMSSGNPFGINAIADEGMFYSSGETACSFFAAQAKLRDLA